MRCGAIVPDHRAHLGFSDSVGGDGSIVIVVVVIDGLAEQCDFKNAGIDESFAFIDQCIRATVDFAASGVGDDAIGAELVASACDTHVG